MRSPTARARIVRAPVPFSVPPNTFDAVRLMGAPRDGFGYLAAHLTQMKRRTNTKFDPMSRAAGFGDTDEPLTMAGVLFEPNDTFNIGAGEFTTRQLWIGRACGLRLGHPRRADTRLATRGLCLAAGDHGTAACATFPWHPGVTGCHCSFQRFLPTVFHVAPSSLFHFALCGWR